MGQERVCVFNIQHYSLQDGPGIRTTVFLKGCPLCCRWCCNPESQSFEIEENSSFDSYRQMTVEEILDEVEADDIFYRHGDGGMTVSGGEPLAHGSFTIQLLKEAQERYLSTAIETSGAVSREILLEAAGYLNYIYYDVKSVDDEKHKKWTDVSNEQILSNLKALTEACTKLRYPPKLIVRTPVVPGFNDTPEDILAIKNYLKSIGQTEHELLRYHRFGKSKYEKLGREYPMGDAVLDDEKWRLLSAVNS